MYESVHGDQDHEGRQAKAEFLDNEEDVNGYTIGLRSIDRSYIIFEWSVVHRAYVQVIAWYAEV